MSQTEVREGGMKLCNLFASNLIKNDDETQGTSTFGYFLICVIVPPICFFKFKNKLKH